MADYKLNMRVKDYIGKTVRHREYGLVFVDSAKPRSKAMVNITVMQRAKGWCEFTEKYKRYFIGASLNSDHSRTLTWGFSHTDEYGIKDTINIKDIL